MDEVGAAVAALGALVLLGGAVRAALAAGRAVEVAVRATARAAVASTRTLGVRGLLAGVAGAASATATTGALASTAIASPAPTAGRPVPAPQVQPHSSYVVRPGDSLWAIAARHLGQGASSADIAAEWPRWYRANRAVIGSNPSHLLVGTSLAVPDGRRTGTSASPHHESTPSGADRTAQELDPDRR